MKTACIALKIDMSHFYFTFEPTPKSCKANLKSSFAKKQAVNL